MYRRVDDTNAGQVVDTTLPTAATDAVRFKGGFAGATDALYVATVAGTLHERTPAGTWTACLSASRLPRPAARDDRHRALGRRLRQLAWFARYGRSQGGGELGRAHLRRQPQSAKITAIKQTANQFVIFKEDGSLFTINADGTTNDLFPGLRVPPSPDNGRRVEAWLDALWFRAGPSFYRLDMPGASLTPAGPGQDVRQRLTRSG